MSNSIAVQTGLGDWSPEAEPVPVDVQDWAKQVKSEAQTAVNTTVGEFKEYDVARFIKQVVSGSNYVVKVDTGNGDDKFVDVQFVWPLEPNEAVTFTAAKQSSRNSRLGPIKG